MNVYLRVDMGGSHGMGHLVRMRALAQALQAVGARVTFITESPELAAEVAPQAHAVFCGSPYTELLFLADADVLVIDSAVPLSEATYATINEAVPLVRVDHPQAQPGTCALLLAPCAHWDEATVQRLQAAFGPRFLYGWPYVLLEEETRVQPRLAYEARVDGPVVLCAGGSDPEGLLRQMALWLADLIPAHAWVALVPAHGPLPSLPSWVRATPFARAWIQSASLLLTTWGVTCYEALWWGAPAVMLARDAMTAADAGRLSRASAGALLAAGALPTLPKGAFPSLVESLCQHPEVRQRMAEASQGLFDGHGALRAAHAILTLGASS